MDYVLFGIQGSGKGTQGKIMAEHLGAAYFEMGGELRRLARENSKLGRKVKSIIDAGHLVPNKVVMEIVENFAQGAGGCGAGVIIFDGIPRNKEQNDSLETLLQKLERKYTGVFFELSRDDAENRLVKRRFCGECKTVYPAAFKDKVCGECGGIMITRTDDNAASIRTRIDIFNKETMPIIEAWKKKGKMISVDASKTIDEVTEELFGKL